MTIIKSLCGALAISLAISLASCASGGEATPDGAESAAAAQDGASCPTGGVYTKITPEKALEYMNGASPVVVDVRTAQEYAEGHVEGAINLPLESIGDEMPAELPDADALILVYCRSGRRSKLAAEKLIALGYLKVCDFGGITDWPYGTVTD